MTRIGTAVARAGSASGKQGAVLRALLLEDDSADAALNVRELQQAGFNVSFERVDSPEELRRQIRSAPPQIVLADYNLGAWKGIEAVEILRKEGVDIPVILVTGALGDTTAVECIKRGATDYVLKDALGKLPLAVRRALHEQQLRKQRREAEEELARSVKDLARSNQELEQFAYVASHDLQEPLRMVAAYTQLLAEKYQGKLDAQADKYIRYAVDGAVRMQTLIQDLLAFSRAGRAEMELASTDCTATARQALLNLEAAVKDSQAEIQIDPLPTLFTNASQLRQIFQNLVGNALKFRGPRPLSVRVSAAEAHGEWIFSVADNGIGIAPDQAENIFTIFHRLHTRDEYPGNGIGLSICRKIVERHGGRIWVESELGRGTTFKFSFPAQERNQTASHGDNSSDDNQTRGAARG